MKLLSRTTFHHSGASSSQLTEQQWRDYCFSAMFISDPTDDRSRLVTTKGKRAPGTCEWVLSTTTYETWLSSKSLGLWLCGGPGKGKTMLSIYLTEELEKRAAQEPGATVSYFFCENRDDKHNTAISLLRGIMWKFIQQRPVLIEHLISTFKVQREQLFTHGSFETLWRIFNDMIQDGRLGTAYCVLDGLDECEEVSLELLCNKLRELLPTPTQLKLIVVSRQIPECLSRAMRSALRIRLDPDSDEEVSKDVETYVAFKMIQLVIEKRYPEKLHVHVENVLRQRSCGTFLWISFAIDNLMKVSLAETQECLDSIPAGLEGIYERMLLQVRENGRQTVADILHWAALAVSPLSVEQLGVAIEIKRTSFLSSNQLIRQYVGFCGYLLSISENKVTLIHQSVKDYLLREEPGDPREVQIFRIQSVKGNYRIARFCLEFIHKARATKASGQDLTEPEKAFLDYARDNWPEHARNSHEAAADLVDVLLLCYPLKLSIDLDYIPSQIMDRYYVTRRNQLHLLHLISCLGIVPIAQKLARGYGSKPWRKRTKLPIKKFRSRGLATLQLATMFGQVEMARWLLQPNQKSWLSRRVDTADADTIYPSALRNAVECGWEDIVRLLLENKADVNKATGFHEETPLHSAARQNGCVNIATLLLKHGAPVDALDYRWQTPLYLAVSFGSRAVIEALLNFGANIDAQCHGRTPLQLAIREDKRDLAELLLSRAKPNVEDLDSSGLTLLHLAIWRHYEQVAKRILDFKADPNVLNYEGYSPFHQAVVDRAPPTMMRLLLEHGADVDLPYKKAAPLHMIVRGSLTIPSTWDAVDKDRIDQRNSVAISKLQVLLEHGANVNALCGEGRTPLDDAMEAKYLREEKVALLKSYHAKISSELHR